MILCTPEDQMTIHEIRQESSNSTCLAQKHTVCDSEPNLSHCFLRNRKLLWELWYPEFQTVHIHSQRLKCYITLTTGAYSQLKNRWQGPCCLGLFPVEKTSGTWDSFYPTGQGASKHNHSHHLPQTLQHLNVKEDLQNKQSQICELFGGKKR